MASKSKYDTNPLDEGYARKADGEWGAVRSDAAVDTNPVRSRVETAEQDAPTRRYDSGMNGSYPSVFVPPVYQPPSVVPPLGFFQQQGQPTSRPIAGINIPEKLAVMLPYTPFYIGIIAAIIELFLVPRTESNIRFHASQGLALHIAILIVTFLFRLIGTMTGSQFGGGLFGLLAFIFLIISMVRVFKGRPHHIAPLDEPTNWINEHLEPRK